MSSDPLYRIARQITDEVLGPGAYAEVNRGNPDPRIQAEVDESAEAVMKNEKCTDPGPHSPHMWGKDNDKYCKGK